MTATPPLAASGRVRFRRARLIALLSVIGPGLLAGLSDDDPPGITVYSVLGTEYGYELLWVLLISTVALIAFHSLGARMGVVTGQGLMGLIRDRYGPRYGGAAMVLLVLANLGTTCAELAGVAAGFELFGISRCLAVRVVTVGVSALVLGGRFHRIEHFLMALAAVFVAYIAQGRDPTGLGRGRGGPPRAAYAADPRGDLDRHGHRRHHARRLGPQLHSVVRG